VSPVGRGAAIASEALLQILRLDGQDLLERPKLVRQREETVALGGSIGLTTGEPPDSFDSEAATAWLLDRAMPSDNSMVLVEGGPFTIGLDDHEIPDKRFDWRRATPATQVWLPPFLIDRTPVTIEAYDEWCRSYAARAHLWCHAHEEQGKDHHRNTVLDPRIGERNPVTGIDWFDAMAFANSHDKELPSEFQWEAAARGQAGTTWPWGDQWVPHGISYFGTSFETSFDVTLSVWESTLASCIDRAVPKRTTLPVDRQGGHNSQYGLVDMVGNCWEWTRTELISRGPYSPAVAARRQRATSVVIKGGGWSSLPGQLYPSFRGQDAPFCRHDEIGFRCVRQIPISVLKTLASGARSIQFGLQVY
jgi:formylglycine-generating enzyme required for sulfatase activity